ncbi:hypothetical protein M3642_19830 [Priestia megaterium]|nr:hypothetical protein [Priestia megaterium]
MINILLKQCLSSIALIISINKFKGESVLKKIFLNKNKTLIELGYEFLVVCPHCASCAKVIALDDPSPYIANVRRRFICTACGVIKNKVIKANGYGQARVLPHNLLIRITAITLYVIGCIMTASSLQGMDI